MHYTYVHGQIIKDIWTVEVLSSGIDMMRPYSRTYFPRTSPVALSLNYIIFLKILIHYRNWNDGNGQKTYYLSLHHVMEITVFENNLKNKSGKNWWKNSFLFHKLKKFVILYERMYVEKNHIYAIQRFKQRCVHIRRITCIIIIRYWQYSGLLSVSFHSDDAYILNWYIILYYTFFPRRISPRSRRVVNDIVNDVVGHANWQRVQVVYCQIFRNPSPSYKKIIYIYTAHE